MVTVSICVGSSCHVKGARKLIAALDDMIKKHGLGDRVELKGSFCMERCGEGMNWQIDDKPLTSQTVEEATAAFKRLVIDKSNG